MTRIFFAVLFGALLTAVPSLPIFAQTSCSTGDPRARDRCAMVEAVLGENIPAITRLAKSPGFDLNEDLTNKAGAAGHRSYLSAAIESWPARLKSAAALIRLGEKPNGNDNLLAQPIAAHLSDSGLVKVVDFMLDQGFNPDFPTTSWGDHKWPIWMSVIVHGCRTKSPVPGQVLASFASHGAHFDAYHEPLLGNGNMYHVVAYALDLAQELSATTNAPKIGLCPFDWTVIKETSRLLDETDVYGNRPIDLIGFYFGYPESKKCTYYTQWQYQQYLDSHVFGEWVSLFEKLGSPPPKSPKAKHDCVLPKVGF